MSSSNIVPVYLPLDLQLLINQDCAKDPDYHKHQKSATLILRILTEHYRNQLPKEMYEKFVEEYSMSAIEQKERNRLKREEAQIKQKEDPQIRKLREEIARCEIELKDKNCVRPDNWKYRLAIAKKDLEIATEAQKEK